MVSVSTNLELMHCDRFCRLLLLCFLLVPQSPASAATKSAIQERADRFLSLANAGYQAVYRVNSEAQWTAVTDVTPEHDAAAEATGKAYAAFNGNPAIIKEARVKSVRRLQPSHLTLFPQGTPRAQASLATVELVLKVTQNCWRSFGIARISRANKPFAPFVGHADRAPIGKHLEAKKNQDQLDILSERDETLGSAVQSGFKRIRSWQVPPNWSRGDWFEELTAAGTAAA